MWGKIVIPMYWLWLHGLYGLYGRRCPLSPKRLINLISLWHIGPLRRKFGEITIEIYFLHTNMTSAEWWLNCLGLCNFDSSPLSSTIHVLVIIGLENVWSPVRHQAIIGTNYHFSWIIRSVRPRGTNRSEIWIKQQQFWFNTLRLRQNGRHWVDDLFKYIFWNENIWIWFKISLKFVPKVPINNIPALVQIMALYHGCITDAYMRHSASMRNLTISVIWGSFSSSLLCQTKWISQPSLQRHTWNRAVTEFIYYQAWSTTADSNMNKILFTFSYLWFQALATGRSDRDLQFYHCGKSHGMVLIFYINFIHVLIRRFLHFYLAISSWHGNSHRITGPLWGELIPVVCEDRWVPFGPLWGPVDSLKRTSNDVSFVVNILFRKSVQLRIQCANRFHAVVPCPLNGLQWL